MPINGNWRALGCMLAIIVFTVPCFTFAEDQMEEVVVTGSYIKRDSFDSPSPLTVIDQTAIADNATPALGEVIVNETFNYGSDFLTNRYAARTQEGNSTSANLRGLGSTLMLIDGRRSLSSNLNNVLPQIAIARMDILKDGASALYGTDAVAGVVNIITRKDFTGIQMSGFFTQDSEDTFYEGVFDFIVGSNTDNGHYVVAGNYRKKTELTQWERPEYLRGGWSNVTGNPGRFYVPTRDPTTGALTGGRTTQRDPGCGVWIPGYHEDIGKPWSYPTGRAQGSDCLAEFGADWNYMDPSDQWSLWTDLSYQFTDNLTMEIEFTATRQNTISRGSPTNSGGRQDEYPTIAGTHPGNPFQAMVGGQRIYAQDADGDGIPDRGTVDANGDGLMDVILAANPFDPASGIPFNEDVVIRYLAPVFRLGPRPKSYHSDGNNHGNATRDEIQYRLVDSLTYQIPDTSWQASGYLMYEKIENNALAKANSMRALTEGIEGTLLATPANQGGTETYWNPFSTQTLHCENRVCEYTGTPDFANTQAVMEAINIEAVNVTNSSYVVGEVVLTGDVMELPAGMLRAAVGAQYRDYEFFYNADPTHNMCDWFQDGCAVDWGNSQESKAAFFELAVPAMRGNLGNLELQIAGRYSDYGSDLTSFDPKIALLYQPTDWMSVRASWSQAFKIPSLTNLYGPVACYLQPMHDTLKAETLDFWRSRCAGGNTDLEPEEADIWNVGASFSLMEGDLNFGVDYAVYDFTNRISAITGQQVLDQDYAKYLAAGNTAGDAADIAAWIAGPESNNITRDASGDLIEVLASTVNANTMKTRAVDLYGRYRLATSKFGNFGFKLEGTYVAEFSYDLGFGANKGDGAGSQNESVGEVPPLPQWRVTGTVNWNLNAHHVLLRLRWIDSFKQDMDNAYFAAINPKEFPSITYTDLTYSYTFNNLFGGDRPTTLEVGGRNIFDEMPKPMKFLGAIETFVYDVRGEMWFVKLVQDL